MSLGEIPLFFKIGEEPEKIKKTQKHRIKEVACLFSDNIFNGYN
jgi:hypothetical protein